LLAPVTFSLDHLHAAQPLNRSWQGPCTILPSLTNISPALLSLPTCLLAACLLACLLACSLYLLEFCLLARRHASLHFSTGFLRTWEHIPAPYTCLSLVWTDQRDGNSAIPRVKVIWLIDVLHSAISLEGLPVLRVKRVQKRQRAERRAMLKQRALRSPFKHPQCSAAARMQAYLRSRRSVRSPRLRTSSEMRSPLFLGFPPPPPRGGDR
jgi:hypothetical protein